MTDDRPREDAPQGISFDKPSPYAGPPPTADAPYGDPTYPGAGFGPAGYGPAAYGPAAPGSFPPVPGYGFHPGPPPGPKPSSNIGWAIASIFLFWPLCIPAFIASSRVDGAWFAGDYFGAQKASKDAKKFGMIGVIVGASLIVAYILFVVILFGILFAAASHAQPVYNYPS